MNDNIVVGIIGFFSIWIVLFLYYLLYAGWIKWPNFGKKKSNVKKLEEANEKKAKEEKNKSKDKNDIKHLTEVKFLMNLYHIDWRYLYFKRLLLLYSFLDALIIIIVFEVIMLIPWGLLLQCVIAFVLFLGLIYSIYSILGKYLLMRGYGNNEHE